jgi:hypothetical protein
MTLPRIKDRVRGGGQYRRRTVAIAELSSNAPAAPVRPRVSIREVTLARV